jgi:hypothetical protein
MSDLSTLFSKDPFKCSQQDIQEIVSALRARFSAYKKDNASGAGKMKVVPNAKQLELAKTLDMKDVDI